MRPISPIAIAMLFSAPACAMQAPQVDPTRDGVQVAERWLALVDAGKGAQSWTEAGPVFQGAMTQENWAAALQAARGPLGALASRTLASASPVRSLPGLPEGDYVVIQYRAAYAARPVTETLVTARDKDGSWKVITYLIQ